MTYPREQKTNQPQWNVTFTYLTHTKNKFDYTKKGVNLMSDEEEVALIERGEDGEVDPYKQKKEMVCLLCNNKSYTK